MKFITNIATSLGIHKVIIQAVYLRKTLITNNVKENARGGSYCTVFQRCVHTAPWHATLRIVTRYCNPVMIHSKLYGHSYTEIILTISY